MIEFPNPEDCLAPTSFIDSDASTIRECVQNLQLDNLTPRERAVKIFNFVRDEIAYEFSIRVTPEEFKASFTVTNRRGYCVRKALLLGALCRAVDIPSVVILCNMRDQSLSPKVVEALGTDIMFYHGLAGIYLDGRWLRLDASLSPGLVEKRQYRLVEFDGKSDALQENTTLNGDPHMEYVAYHGAYIDLPYDQMMAGYAEGFNNSNKEMMAQLGLKSSFK
jgi:transglutaminase-like putative cysteine protease